MRCFGWGGLINANVDWHFVFPFSEECRDDGVFILEIQLHVGFGERGHIILVVGWLDVKGLGADILVFGGSRCGGGRRRIKFIPGSIIYFGARNIHIVAMRRLEVSPVGVGCLEVNIEILEGPLQSPGL